MIIKLKRQFSTSFSTEEQHKIIASELLTKKVKYVKTINKSRIEFESKSLFSYINFDLFQMIDYGSINLSYKKDIWFIEYSIVLIRMWLPVCIATLVPMIVLEEKLWGLALGSVYFLFTYSFNRIAHWFFLKKIVAKLNC